MSQDILEVTGFALNFPLIADADRRIAALYDMIHLNASHTATVRSVFVVGPDNKVKLTLTYPARTGRNFQELLRAIERAADRESRRGDPRRLEAGLFIIAPQSPTRMRRSGFRAALPQRSRTCASPRSHDPIERDAGGNRDVERVDEFAHGNPHPESAIASTASVRPAPSDPTTSATRADARRGAISSSGSDGARGVSATIVSPAACARARGAGQSSASQRANGTCRAAPIGFPNRLAIERIARRWAEQDAVGAKRGGVAKNTADVVGVRYRLEDDQRPRAID